MILVDTSVWVNHFRRTDASLVKLLQDGSAGVHPFIVGELAGGNLPDRAATLADLMLLSRVPIATEAEVHRLVDSHHLWGKGLGWVDLHLLAAALIAGWDLWSADRAMATAALAVGLARP